MFDKTQCFAPYTAQPQADLIAAALAQARRDLLALHGLTAFDPAHEGPIEIKTLDTVALIEAALQQYRQAHE